MEKPFPYKIEEQTDEIAVFGVTGQGRGRSLNEDYYGYFLPVDPVGKANRGSLFAVSDGTGGSAAGEVVSAEAVNVLLQEYYFGDHSERLPERLKSSFQRTAIHIYDLAASNRSVYNVQCTLTALLVRQDKFHIVHIGDSKAYLLRNGKLSQITKDHSLVGKLVRLGMISKEEARAHPNRNVLLRAMGEGPILPPDVYSGNLCPGDRFCLITDGMIEQGTEDELRDVALRSDVGAALAELVRENNRRGGSDNMTALIVQINQIKESV